MKQHFLLSAKARTLSVLEVARMSDDDAYAAFKAVRFSENDGEPFCPHCGSVTVYTYQARRLFKCKACEKQFTITSGTIFSGRKLPLRDILAAIAMFVNGANGASALKLGRDLGRSYKTAFVLLHKLRETMGEMRSDQKFTGIVEVDGVWVGGKIRRRTPQDKRIDFKKPRPPHISPALWEKMLAHRAKQRTIVTIRERRRGGRSASFVCHSEKEAVADILAMTDDSAIIHADEGSGWVGLQAHRDVRHVKHLKRYVAEDGTHINWVESFNSRVRRAERGVHHRLSGHYLQGYADEFCWREDFRRIDNGRQFSHLLKAAAGMPTSRTWKGYWQRRLIDGPRPEFTRKGAGLRNTGVAVRAPS